MMNHEKITEMASFMRRKIVDISFASGTSTHIGGALSMVEIMAVLYGHILNFDANNPEWENRDRFILSKGHGVLGFYPALLAAGIISEETFNSFQQNGSDLIAHPVMNLSLGIESSNGSLGHGISMAVGIAYAAKLKQKEFQTYTLIGDGEANEGSVWEAAMLAAHLKLNNLTVILDNNKMQNDGAGSDVLQIDNFAERFAAFGWHSIEVDGHNITDIEKAFNQNSNGKPKIIVAHTIKGKGVSFMENEKAWHHNRVTKPLYEQAIACLEENK